MIDEYVARLIQHYSLYWGEYSYQARWCKGQKHDLPHTFRVLVFEPTGDRETWIYATCGMSIDLEGRIELHLVSPLESGLHIELLTAVAHYHCTGHTLTLGATVNFGREWLPGSNCSFGLITRPYPFGPGLEELSINEDLSNVDCYWLLPITQAERDYKKQHGLEALEVCFQKAGLEYSNPTRNSVIPVRD